MSVRLGGKETATSRLNSLRRAFGRSLRPIDIGPRSISLPEDLLQNLPRFPRQVWTARCQRVPAQNLLFRTSFREHVEGDEAAMMQIDAGIDCTGAVLNMVVRELKIENDRWVDLSRKVLFPGLTGPSVPQFLTEQMVTDFFDETRETHAVRLLDHLLTSFDRLKSATHARGE